MPRKSPVSVDSCAARFLPAKKIKSAKMRSVTHIKTTPPRTLLSVEERDAMRYTKLMMAKKTKTMTTNTVAIALSFTRIPQ